MPEPESADFPAVVDGTIIESIATWPIRIVNVNVNVAC
jgi:hypothetical protein